LRLLLLALFRLLGCRWLRRRGLLLLLLSSARCIACSALAFARLLLLLLLLWLLRLRLRRLSGRCGLSSTGGT